MKGKMINNKKLQCMKEQSHQGLAQDDARGIWWL
jgi:hypothetical protein